MLTETSCAPSDEADIVVEGEEGGDGEVFCIWAERHGGVSEQTAHAVEIF